MKNLCELIAQSQMKWGGEGVEFLKVVEVKKSKERKN